MLTAANSARRRKSNPIAMQSTLPTSGSSRPQGSPDTLQSNEKRVAHLAQTRRLSCSSWRPSMEPPPASRRRTNNRPRSTRRQRGQTPRRRAMSSTYASPRPPPARPRLTKRRPDRVPEREAVKPASEGPDHPFPGLAGTNNTAPDTHRMRPANQAPGAIPSLLAPTHCSPDARATQPKRYLKTAPRPLGHGPPTTTPLARITRCSQTAHFPRLCHIAVRHGSVKSTNTGVETDERTD